MSAPFYYGGGRARKKGAGRSDVLGGGGLMREQLFEVAEAAQHLLVEVVGLLVQLGDLELGLDVHVVLDVGAHLVLLRLTVLADEDEAGEEDGFERDDHREQAEGEGVEAARAVGVAREEEGVQRNPEGEQEGVDDEEGDAAGEPGEPVGDPLDEGQALLDLLVDVARDARAQELVGLARHLAHRRQHVERRLGLLLEEEHQVPAVELDQLGRRQGQGRGRARPRVEERDLAEEVAGPGDVEDDLLARRVLDEELHLALADEEKTLPRLARPEESLVVLELDEVNDLGQRAPVCVVEQPEELYVFEQRGVNGHYCLLTVGGDWLGGWAPSPFAV